MTAAHENTPQQTFLVLAATGKTGRRVADRLRQHQEVTVRAASRAATGPERFDWQRPETWDAALDGVDAIYLVYMPEVTAPQAAAEVGNFLARAVAAGVRRVVLLSAYGFPEASAPVESAVADSGVPEWTILVPNWFSQNFGEDFLLDPVRAGAIDLPAGDGRAPWVDAEDIADVAVAALTEPGHHGRRYVLTGSRSLSLAEAAAEIAAATGRDITYRSIDDATFAKRLGDSGLPDEIVTVLGQLMRLLREGGADETSDDVRMVLGREPRSFAAYVRATAATGVWDG